MTIEEYFQNYDKWSVKKQVELFNALDVKERKSFLALLSDGEYSTFIDRIRKQAVADFWTHEQELIKNGQSTRDWTPEQIEDILHISEKTGKMSINGDVTYDIDGESYYGHHMLNVAEHPEYAGDWRNIQALNHQEHYAGAHGGNTTNPTNGFYDVETGKTEEINVSKLEQYSSVKDVDGGYISTEKSIFKSDAEIREIYAKCGELTDGEMLALKNIELSMDTSGGLDDFNRGLDVANRYNSPNFETKVGIMTDELLGEKYHYFDDMSDADIDTLKAYEYFKSRNVDDFCIEKLGVKSDNTLLNQYKFLNDSDSSLDMFRVYEYQKSKSSINLDDTKVYFDADGKAIGLSCYDDLSGKAALELKLSDTESYLSDADMSNKYVDYDNYSNLDKLKARQYEYERNQIGEMVDNNISSQNDIELKTFEELKQKYTFIDKNTDAEVIKELQIAEYRDAKYGTNTSESIEVHCDENGKMSCTSNQGFETTKNVELKNNSKFTTTIDDLSKFQSAEYMSTICPEYENLTDLQKLQLQQIELDARNHDFTKLQQTISGDKTGSVGDVRITYDVEGKVTGIDMSGIRQGSAINTEGSSAVFDISSDGTTKVRLDSPAETRAWWRNETPSIINNEKVGSINGVDARQFRNAYKNYSSVNHPNIDEAIGQAIDKIPPTNTDGNALAKGIYEGNNSIGFSDGTMETSNGTMNLSHNSKAARLGKTLDFMGVAADAADAYRTYKTAYAQMEAGDFEGADDTIGSYICTTTMGAIGGSLGSVAAGILVTAGVVSGPVGWLIILCGGVLFGAVGQAIWDDYLDPLSNEYDAAGNANPPRDPLVIDLGGLGIELTTLENGVHFDLDKNGFAEKTAWIGKEEGFLVLDRNGDGEITDGGELFGDRVELENGLISVSGFQALSELDDNKDGMVDSNDSMWNQLRVWIDKDQNGVSEGELKTLEELGIISISLNVFKDANVDSETGTMEAEYAMVTFADGTQRKISEFWFPVNASDTQQSTQDGETIKTIGNVPDIYIAIEQDKTGRLSELYEKFVASKDFIEKRYLTKEILYFLTNSKEIEPNSRGGNVDARDLHVIETFMGRDFFGVTGANPNVNAAAILKDMMISIENMYFNYLNANTVDGMYVNTIGSNTDENGNITLDFSIFNMLLEDKIVCGENVDSLIYSIAAYLVGYDEINGTTGYAEFNQYCTELSTHYGTLVEFAKSANTYLGTEDNNGFWGTDNNDFVFGFEGNDSFNGVAGNDVLVGGKGNDTLHGENGDDILYGGEGNDTLNGGCGNDHLYGGEGDDTLDGSYGENHLYGGAGNDTFTGIYGSDTYHFEAGDGQDIIETFTMHSRWDRTDDKIVFGESVKKSDIHAKKNGYDLILENTVTGDTITIKNAYSYTDGRWQIKDIRFANGDVLTEEDIKTMIKENGVHGTDGDDSIGGINACYGYHENETMYGYQGNDRLNGENGDDILYGGEGNDTLNGGCGNDHLYGGEGDDTLDGSYGENHLYGGAGNDTFTGIYGSDTYHFEAGDGQDIIETFTMHSRWDRTDDKIVFGESVKKSDIHAKKNGYDLILENTVTGDTITIKNAYSYSNGRWQIKDISFENGDVLTEEDIKELIRANGIHGTDGNDTICGLTDMYGYSANEIIDGGAGNDTLYGDSGDDIYIFEQGDGQDKISDRYGSNTISFGEGITADNLLITTQNYNVAINFTDSEDMITLMDALRNDAYKNFELNFMNGMIGAIDLSGETDNQIHVIREAETQAETVTDMVATELPSEVQTDTQVLQMVDVMNTGSGENVSAVETTEPFNTVEETLLFVEQ